MKAVYVFFEYDEVYKTFFSDRLRINICAWAVLMNAVRYQFIVNTVKQARHQK